MRALTLTAAALLAACNGGTTRTIETSDGSRVSVDTTGAGNVSEIRLTGSDGNTATMTSTGDGQVRLNIPGMNATIQTGGGWPAGIAAVAPAYPGAAVTGSFAGTGPEGGGGTVTFTTADSPAQVIAFYKPRATAAGLAERATVNSDGNTMFTAQDEASGRSLTVQASAEGGKTTGSIMYGAGKR